jgi:Mce-associated membrane protein
VKIPVGKTLNWFPAAAVAVAVVVAAWGGFDWWQAAHDDGMTRAGARDSALQTGRTAVAGLTSLDYRQATAGYQHWLDVSGGPLHDELAQGRQANLDRVAQAKTVTTGTVTDGAVTGLDAAGGTAELIVSVELVVTPEGGQAVEKHNRFKADLTRGPGGWLVTGLGQVPVEENS